MGVLRRWAAVRVHCRKHGVDLAALKPCDAACEAPGKRCFGFGAIEDDLVTRRAIERAGQRRARQLRAPGELDGAGAEAGGAGDCEGIGGHFIEDQRDAEGRQASAGGGVGCGVGTGIEQRQLHTDRAAAGGKGGEIVRQ
jgi:hypothetical protein